eukprot:c26712_g1_i2 orf=498-2510(-)
MQVNPWTIPDTGCRMSLDVARSYPCAFVLPTMPFGCYSLPVGFSSRQICLNVPVTALDVRVMVRRFGSGSFLQSEECGKGTGGNCGLVFFSQTELLSCPCSSRIVLKGGRKMCWHRIVWGPSQQRRVDAGLRAAAFGDKCGELFNGEAEEASLECYLESKDLEAEMPLACDYFDENSLVHKDLKAWLGNWEFFRAPFLPSGPDFNFGHVQESCTKPDPPCDVRGPASFQFVLEKKLKNAEGYNQSLQIDAVKMPVSLRMLKRRKNLVKASESMRVGESFKEAFLSMVFMIRTLQSHTLQIRQVLFCEDLRELVKMMHKEVQLSFVWLFQQVFSCTPKLMFLVMILLTDFTVYSTRNNVALFGINPLTSPSTRVSVLKDDLDSLDAARVLQFVDEQDGHSGGHFVNLVKLFSVSENRDFGRLNNEGTGTGVSELVKAVGGTDGDAWPEEVAPTRTIYPADDSVLSCSSSDGIDANAVAWGQPARGLGDISSLSSERLSGGFQAKERQLAHLQKQASRGLESMAGDFHQLVTLDEDTMNRLVAPVNVELEPDSYTCYDRTDLLYQHAISVDSKNSMLLANYAQFLYVVRHDHNRAQEFFTRAMEVDPVDGEIIGRFATFLWLAQRDLVAAERAYRAAIAADPDNPFCTASYAHFLWNCGEEEALCPITPSTG